MHVVKWIIGHKVFIIIHGVHCGSCHHVSVYGIQESVIRDSVQLIEIIVVYYLSLVKVLCKISLSDTCERQCANSGIRYIIHTQVSPKQSAQMLNSPRKR